MFIDDWCADLGFYKELPLNFRDILSFGQLFLTHAYYPHENLQFWRPIPEQNDPTKTIANSFRIEPAGQDAFKKKLPLGAPKLETNEEFIVVRAKKRPVIMLLPESASLDKLNKGYRMKLQRHLCVVAQVFSLTDKVTGQAKCDPDLLDRIRRMEFPQFMFLPKKPGVFEVDSLLRLDELQSSFTGNLTALQYALNDEAAKILRDQFRLLLTGRTSKEYIDLREFFLHDV